MSHLFAVSAVALAFSRSAGVRGIRKTSPWVSVSWSMMTRQKLAPAQAFCALLPMFTSRAMMTVPAMKTNAAAAMAGLIFSLIVENI